MHHFARLRAIWMAFYSRDLYRSAASQWAGRGLLYLLLLLAIAWLPSAIRWHAGLTAFAEQSAGTVKQLPTVTIEQGVMHATPPGRHEVRGSDGAIVAIIDDGIDAVPNDMTSGALVVTRREAGVVPARAGERRVWQFTPGMNMTVTPARVSSIIRSLPPILPIVGYALCLAVSFAFRTVQVLVYAAIAQAMGGRAPARLDYPAAMRLAAVAVTPVIVLRTLAWFAPSEPSWYVRWPLAIAITLAYLWFGARSAAAREAVV